MTSFPNELAFARAAARVFAAAPDIRVRDGGRAMAIARALQSRQPPTIELAEIMAMAAAETGQYGDAVRWQRQAIEAAAGGSRRDLAERMAGTSTLYEQGRPAARPGGPTSPSSFPGRIGARPAGSERTRPTSMNVRRRAIWLLVLGALAASEIRSRSLQLSAQPYHSSSSDEVTLRVIVVDSAEKAQRIVTRLNAGENFIALAQAESIDPTAAAGGLLGKLALSTLPPVLKDALVGVAPGQLSPVVQIPTGFAILKVVDDTDPANRNMNAATPATLATEASVKYVIDVSGLLEAEAVLQAFPKPTDWNQNPPHDLPDASRVSGLVPAVAR